MGLRMDTVVRTPEALGRLIREQRKRQGLRQAELAAMIGASHVFLGDVEKGKPTVQLGRVLKLLDELGLTLRVDVPDEDGAAS
jgi:y4mF family transcriptional regulator